MDLEGCHDLVDLLDGDQVRHRVDHAADLGTVLLDDDVVEALETQRAQRLALVALAADAGTDLGDLQPWASGVPRRPGPQQRGGSDVLERQAATGGHLFGPLQAPAARRRSRARC